jgi:hypothetical protein
MSFRISGGHFPHSRCTSTNSHSGGFLPRCRCNRDISAAVPGLPAVQICSSAPLSRVAARQLGDNFAICNKQKRQE